MFNYNNELVELKADRIKGQCGKWYPNSFDNAGKLIRNNEFDNVILNNFILSSEDPANIIFIDLEGDDGYEYIIARSFYKISFSPGNQGKSYLYLNAVSLDFYDFDLAYDYKNDKFYEGEVINKNFELSNGTIIKTYESLETNSIENYWKNSLFIIPDETNSYPRLVWGRIPDFAAAGYKIYRAVSNVANPSNLNYNFIDSTTAEEF